MDRPQLSGAWVYMYTIMVAKESEEGRIISILITNSLPRVFRNYVISSSNPG